MATRTGATAAPGSRNVRVLVVDDNAGFRETLVAILDAEQLQVVGQAADGREALALARSTTPDVVLMDVRMPAMDGIETTRRLKALDGTIGVVALTGYEDQHIVRDMLVAGASGYVLKDSDADEIVNAIREAAAGGAVLSPEVTPTVIEELTEALERERHRTRELEIAQEALLERAARRHDMISRIGHELRTPTTVIVGIAQALSRGIATEPERDEVVAALLDRSTALATLVERFEAALEAGLTEWADVNEVAVDMRQFGPRVRVETSPGPAMASLNRTAARRILQELVANALAFSPDAADVTVSVTVNGHGPRVRVADRGPGIATDELERIFAPLEQLESLNTREHQGAGIGLTVARMAARAMEGDVTLELSGPEGSTFLWEVSRPRESASA
jgi:DNA-binding NarL/FixJ family response regulator